MTHPTRKAKRFVSFRERQAIVEMLRRLAKRNAVNKQVTCALLQPSLCATET